LQLYLPKPVDKVLAKLGKIRNHGD
jgi:hypothetical protein